ncbi:MAG: glycosyltransferase family 2 protein [Acidobacteriota bacterium]|nr:MAG: glycosyltransferase family 2 protein [Acidobacteriota bacterium]
MRISAVIIARDEEAKIGNAIRSVLWADEVLVVDSGSVDGTRAVAADLGAKVVYQEWLGFGGQKQFAVDSARNNMILSLDADEAVSDKLADEIRSIVQTGDVLDAYYMPRLAFYLGRPVKHSGWYPDRQLRLFDRTKGEWSRAKVHESVIMRPDARVGVLKNDLLHYSIDSVSQHAEMIQSRYAPLSAEQMHQDGIRTSIVKIGILPIWTFFHTYVLRLGVLDGLAGLAISGFASYNVFLKHLLLYELGISGSTTKSGSETS